MKPRSGTVAALAIALLLVTGTAQAEPITGPDVASFLTLSDTAWPDSPCVGQGAVILDDTVPAGVAGEALLYLTADGSYAPIGCDINVNPAWWASQSRLHRCEFVVHERGHNAGMQHALTGVMAPTGGYYAPCARTLRERIVGSVEGLSPPASIVRCGAMRGRVVSCHVTTFRQTGEATYAQTGERRYRVRTRGEAFAIQRVTLRPRFGR